MQNLREEKMFATIEPEMFVPRIARNLRASMAEFSAAPGQFLQTAFFANGGKESIIYRFFTAVGSAVSDLLAHPLRFLRSAFSADAMALGYIHTTSEGSAAFTTDTYSTSQKIRRGRYRKSVFTVSVIAHLALFVVAFYFTFIAPYAGLTVVDKPYRKYDDKLIAVVPVGGLRLNQKSLENTMSLDEIKERERRRREDAARRKQADEERRKREEERLKAEEERIAKEKAEQEAKDKAATATADKPKFGEINEAPIKDILGKVYSLHQVGFINVDTKNLSLMLSFTVEKDGSISNIKTMKSSGNNLVDKYAKEILWNLGESHALGPLYVLTSNTIRLDLNEQVARLSITGFAPTEGEAKVLAANLNFMFMAMRAFRKNSSPDVAELLSHMKITYTGKRVDADLTISNARAGELLKSKFGNGQ